jgi:hypothetical protein
MSKYFEQNSFVFVEYLFKGENREHYYSILDRQKPRKGIL